MSVLPLEQEIEYPTSDGQPMAETSLHRMVMMDLIEGLTVRYAQDLDIWAGGNLFLYYEEGDPAACVAPDVLLAKGVKKWARRTYLLWEEGVPPSLVAEITSRKTRREDRDKKKPLYEHLGVDELILFDPYGEYLRPQLQGYRLVRDTYHPIPLEKDGSLLSQTTGLRFYPEGNRLDGSRLRLVDAVTGERYLWHEESEAARKAAEARAAEEAAAREAAEVRAAEESVARQAAEARVAEAEARATEEAAARQAEAALKEELERMRKR
jgi:Uma2 family endonuclease